MSPLRTIVAAAVASLVTLAGPADAQIFGPYDARAGRYGDIRPVSAYEPARCDAGDRRRGRYDVPVRRRSFDPARTYYGQPLGGLRFGGRRFSLTIGTSPRTALLPVSAPLPVLPPEPVVEGFGDCAHVVELAAALEDSANDLCLDLHLNYAHNRGFNETYAEAYAVYEAARDIHSAEHAGDREYMRSRLAGLDSLFHHIGDDVRGWTRVHNHQVGHLGIVAKMDRMEEDLHHLMDDVGVAPTPVPTIAPLPASRYGSDVLAPAPAQTFRDDTGRLLAPPPLP